MAQQLFTLYPINEYLLGVDLEHIDPQLLPFDLTEGVRIENTEGRIDCPHFTKDAERVGTFRMNALKNVSCALVHRYEASPSYGRRQQDSDTDRGLRDSSEFLTASLAACLRLIRPMPQFARTMQGEIAEDGSLSVRSFEHPTPMSFIPEAHQHFTLRNRDAEDLRRYASKYLDAVRGYGKFQSAASMHESGHFNAGDGYARFWLWCCSLQSIFCTNKPGHREEQVAKARIKRFLGEQTSIYAPGDISKSLPQPSISIADVIDDIFAVRNCLAYGELIPQHYLRDTIRQGVYGDVSHFEVLTEALSFIIRSSL